MPDRAVSPKAVPSPPAALPYRCKPMPTSRGKPKSLAAIDCQGRPLPLCHGRRLDWGPKVWVGLAVSNTPSAAPIAVLDCYWHRGAVSWRKRCSRRRFFVAVCGIGASVPTLAQDEARIFQWSPIARLVGEGQYRAEV
jgi:hypothetical protein